MPKCILFTWNLLKVPIFDDHYQIYLSKSAKAKTLAALLEAPVLGTYNSQQN